MFHCKIVNRKEKFGCVCKTVYACDILFSRHAAKYAPLGPNVAQGKATWFAKFAFGQIRLNLGPPNSTKFNISEFGFKFGKPNNSVKFVFCQ